MKTAAFLLLVLATARWGGAAQRVAVLPFLPLDASHPSEGWSLAEKVLDRIPSGRAVPVNWTSLNRIMDEEGLDKRTLMDARTLRALGRALEVDMVLAGRFKADGGSAVVSPRLVNVRTGRVQLSKEWLLDRDISVPVPEQTVDAPVIPGEEARDSHRDWTCDHAGEIVDSLERRILDLKARYWADQLRKGVAMQGLKFNPGSTITDPDLKREFYGRMKAWMAQDIIPELTPTEALEFARSDLKAIEIARRCGIL